MEIRQLRHFIAVAEAGNMRQASERIHLSHPALSLSIKNLEQSLEVSLFDRSSKGVKLTEAGTLMIDYARAIIKQIEDANSSIKSTASNPSGLVKLGCSPGIRNVLTVPLYTLTREKYPKIAIEIDDSLSPILKGLFEAGLLDLMIDFDTENKDDFICEPLIEEELFLVGLNQPSLMKNDDIEFKYLPNYPIISNIDKSSIYQTYKKYSLETGIQLNYLPGVGSPLGELALAESGIGYVILPWSIIFNRIGDSNLCAKRITNPVMYRKAYLLSPLNRPLSRASLAIKELIKLAIKDAHSKEQWRGRVLFPYK